MDSKIKITHPIAVQWKIPEARLQAKRNSTNDYLQSDIVVIPGTDVQYFVVIYLNGNDGDYFLKQSRVVFYLYFQEKKEIEIKFIISIQSENYDANEIKISDKYYGYASSYFGSVDELLNPEKRFVVNGEMIIKVTGFLMVEIKVPEKIRAIGGTGNILGMELWNQDNKDFAIVADEKEIMAHKWVLSTRSPVFQAMLQPHTLVENKIIIPDFPYNIVETAIKLCYDSRLVKNIPLEDMPFLLQFFDKYEIQSLKAELEFLMILEVNKFTVCRFVNCSIISNSSNLKKKCSKFLEECIRQRTSVNDFSILEKKFVLELLENSVAKVAI